MKKDLLKEVRNALVDLEMVLYEHQVYKPIGGKNASYRLDKGNTNTKTKDHVHAYAKSKGKGKELYSVNRDGTGHDGSSGVEIPKSHANFFRDELNFSIPPSNILESKGFDNLSTDDYELVFFNDDQEASFING